MQAVSTDAPLREFGRGREELEQQLGVDVGEKEDVTYFFFF